MSYLAHGDATTATAVVTIPQTGRQPSQLFNSSVTPAGLHKPQDVHTSAPRRGFKKHPHLQSWLHINTLSARGEKRKLLCWIFRLSRLEPQKNKNETTELKKSVWNRIFNKTAFYQTVSENVLIYLQKIYMQPAEEFEQVDLQTVPGRAPTKTSLYKRESVKTKIKPPIHHRNFSRMTDSVVTFLCW